MARLFEEGIVAPATAPTKKGRFFIDTVLGDIYTSVGTSGVGDWILTTGASFTNWMEATFQPKNTNLDDIAGLTPTDLEVIVSEGGGFTLTTLGNAAFKTVGTGSGEVAAGNRGLPVTATDGQTVVYDATLEEWIAATPSGGGGGGSSWGYALLSMTYSYRSSTTLNPSSCSILTSSISGLLTTFRTVSQTLTLPAGTYRIQIIFKCLTAGKVDATPYIYNFVNAGSGSLSGEFDSYNFGYGPAASASTTAQFVITTKILTLAATTELLIGNAVYINGNGTYNVSIGGTGFTASTLCKASIEVFKLA